MFLSRWDRSCTHNSKEWKECTELYVCLLKHNMYGKMCNTVDRCDQSQKHREYLLLNLRNSKSVGLGERLIGGVIALGY